MQAHGFKSLVMVGSKPPNNEIKADCFDTLLDLKSEYSNKIIEITDIR